MSCEAPRVESSAAHLAQLPCRVWGWHWEFFRRMRRLATPPWRRPKPPPQAGPWERTGVPACLGCMGDCRAAVSAGRGCQVPEKQPQASFCLSSYGNINAAER